MKIGMLLLTGCPDGSDGDWDRAERSLGVRLPDDYRTFIESYGYGAAADIIVFSPFSTDPLLNLVTWEQDDTEGRHGLALDGLPAAYEPANRRLGDPRGSLLAWGRVESGPSLYWLVLGSDPNAWTTVLGDPSEDEWQETALGMTGLLAGLLDGTAGAPLVTRATFGTPVEYVAIKG